MNVPQAVLYLRLYHAWVQRSDALDNESLDEHLRRTFEKSEAEALDRLNEYAMEILRETLKDEAKKLTEARDAAH